MTRKRREPDPQLPLFEDPVRPQYREPKRFYAAVLFMRLVKRCKVYRVSGRQSVIDNRIVSNRQLMMIADSYCESAM